MMTDEIRALARKARWKHTEEWEEGKRLCRKCNKMKLFKEFHRHSKCKNGYNSVCIECRKPLSKAAYKRTSVEYRLWYRAKHRAKVDSIPFDIKVSDIELPEVCPIFKTEFIANDSDKAASLDKIIPSLGYVRGNIQVISNKANRIKSNASVEEIETLLNYLKSIL